MERLVERSNQPGVRIAALHALATIGAGCSRGTIETALDDPDEEVRQAAEEALDRLE
ncbi:HEAT repeat domain-containing protein [Halopiger djelfimassiliensis]|uniref:HEAT repeat domain-containing protein n=1 Tax=Halopiger djelfimassiliensis TaxID=1293047 RepID=UPI00373FCD56